jgi:hypothetical protein
MKKLTSLGIAALTVVLCGAAMPAAAQGLVPVTSTSLEFNVTTTIAPRCGWAAGGAPAASVDLGSLDAAGSKDIPFEVDCNTPFLFTATSQKSALVRQNLMIDLPASFIQEVEYRVNVRLGVRNEDGTATAITETCQAATLSLEGMCPFAMGSSGLSNFTGEAVATSADTALPQSRLRVTWNDPIMGGPTRVAGTYSDVLTISVHAKS